MEKLSHETKTMFEKRKKVYEKGLDEGYETKDAIKYANIWANVNYLGCRYSPALMEIAMKLGKDLGD